MVPATIFTKEETTKNISHGTERLTKISPELFLENGKSERGVKMKVFYPVIFTATHDKKDTFLISIPDIGGMTEGRGIEDAFAMARDYIGCRLYEKEADEIPPASAPKDIDIDKSEFAGLGDSFISIVDLDLGEYRRKMSKKSVRRNVSIPLWLDRAAKEAHLNVSRILQEAIIEKLGLKE